MTNFHQNLTDFIERLEGLNSEGFSKLVDKNLDDDAIEILASHIQHFYDVDDDDEIGGLTQIMISGFLAAQETLKKD